MRIWFGIQPKKYHKMQIPVYTLIEFSILHAEYPLVEFSIKSGKHSTRILSLVQNQLSLKKIENEKCRCNGLCLIAMVWETFDGFVFETRIMIYKITIRHTDKNNRPRGQTIYQINQRLFVTLQRGVEEQLIACECAG